MKTSILILLVLNFSFEGFSQKSLPKLYLGFGLNSILAVELNNTLKVNSINELPLNFVEIDYGIEYSPKQIGCFLEANYSFNYDKNSNNAIQSFRTGFKYSIKLTEKIKIGFGGYYSYTGYKFSFRNTNQGTISNINIQNGNGGYLTFYSRNSSIGGVVSVNINKNLQLRVFSDTSIDSFNWKILNNESIGFLPEKISKIGLNLTYRIFNNKKS